MAKILINYFPNGTTANNPGTIGHFNYTLVDDNGNRFTYGSNTEQTETGLLATIIYKISQGGSGAKFSIAQDGGIYDEEYKIDLANDLNNGLSVHTSVLHDNIPTTEFDQLKSFLDQTIEATNAGNGDYDLLDFKPESLPDGLASFILVQIRSDSRCNRIGLQG